ncbi:hypothetical protein ACFPYJ_19280 [Paenibacillus solisilvae]|uniref:Uncharacterized protein n=1 Tax=Paenibacillus solisilvae TaxID=2486751 RepID=A0ABW0W2B8_9BACL
MRDNHGDARQLLYRGAAASVGPLEVGVYELIDRVYWAVEELEPWTLGGASSIPYIGVVADDRRLSRPGLPGAGYAGGLLYTGRHRRPVGG